MGDLITKVAHIFIETPNMFPPYLNQKNTGETGKIGLLNIGETGKNAIMNCGGIVFFVFLCHKIR